MSIKSLGVRKVLVGAIAAFAFTVQASGAMSEDLTRVQTARVAQSRGDLDTAIGLYGEAIRFDNLSQSNLAIAHMMRGNAWRQKREYDRAIEDYNQALQLNPNYYEAHNNRGNAWSDKRDYDRAIEDYNHALRLNPDDHHAYNNRGVALSAKREYDRAIEDYNDALRLNANYDEAYNNRGIAWRAKGDYHRAIEDYNRALRLNPHLHQAYYNRGNAWLAKREHDRAIEDYSQALRLNSNDHVYYANRGSAWSDKREYDRAIEDFTQALQLNPSFRWGYYSRGIAQFHAGRSERAARDFDRALEIDPSDHYSALWEYLANVRASGDAAATLARRAGKLESSKWPSPVVLLFRENIAPEAMVALAGRPDDGKARANRCEALFFIGHWHLMRGERALAVRSFREALATRVTSNFTFNAARTELLVLGEQFD